MAAGAPLNHYRKLLYREKKLLSEYTLLMAALESRLSDCGSEDLVQYSYQEQTLIRQIEKTARIRYRFSSETGLDTDRESLDCETAICSLRLILMEKIAIITRLIRERMSVIAEELSSIKSSGTFIPQTTWSDQPVALDIQA